MKKKYWEEEGVKGKPYLIAIADFHDTMSMSWTFHALSDYLYGYKYENSFDKKGKLVIKLIKIGKFKKPNGTEIPSGFFFLPDSENVSAVIFSSCGILSKFNRTGTQVKLGSDIPTLTRMVHFYNHNPNADKGSFVIAKAFPKVEITDKKEFVTNRIKMLPVQIPKINSVVPIEITDEGVDRIKGKKEQAYQVMLFVDNSYYILFGSCEGNFEKNLIVFKKIIHTFQLK